MSKRIELTWRNLKGETIVEECDLVSENDLIYLFGDNKPISVITDHGVNNTVGIFMNNQVVFEDEYGLFCLDPQNVLNIKELTC